MVNLSHTFGRKTSWIFLFEDFVLPNKAMAIISIVSIDET